MKKILLFIVMIITFVVSCGGKEGAKSGETPTIKIITVGNGKPANYDTWIQKVNEYVEPKIGAKVDLEVIPWGDWATRRNVITTSNEKFDILFTDIATYVNEVNIGAFLPLDELLAKPEFKDLWNLIPEKYWDGARVNGKIYSVPTYKDSSVSQYFIFDKSLTDKYGFDISTVKELKDIEPFFKAVQKDTNKPSLVLNFQGLYQMFTKYDEAGLGMKALTVKVDDADAKVISTFEDPYVLENLELLHKWYNEGMINPDAATLMENPKYRPFFIAQGWPLAAKTVWGPGNGGEVILTQYGPTVLSNGSIQGSMNAISASSENPDKALAFLQLINTDTKLRDMFAYGEEGVTFDYVDAYGEKRIDNEPGKYADWGVPAYTQGTFFNMSISKNVEVNQWLEVKELNDKAIPSVLLGFSFNSDPVLDELANIQAIYKKYEAELLTGTKEPKELIKVMLEEMKAVGFDKVKDELQKQIDEFRKNK